MSQRNPPNAMAKLSRQRKRVWLACVHCRRRKVKCMTATTGGLPPCMPCERCTKMGLTCTYRSVEAQSGSASGKSSPPSAPIGTRSNLKHPRTESYKPMETFKFITPSGHPWYLLTDRYPVASPQDPFVFKINEVQFYPIVHRSSRQALFRTMQDAFMIEANCFGGPDVWLWTVTREDAVMIEANCIFEVLDSGLCGYARTSPTACLRSDQMGIFFGRPGP
ncbi:hypothetical protein DFH06DRAFT_1310994 [Mycena polygramma]|nr:hypothetical protein DFH06DRAFT_1310994 [Mycena polygramma]